MWAWTTANIIGMVLFVARARKHRCRCGRARPWVYGPAHETTAWIALCAALYASYAGNQFAYGYTHHRDVLSGVFVAVSTGCALIWAVGALMHHRDLRRPLWPPRTGLTLEQLHRWNPRAYGRPLLTINQRLDAAGEELRRVSRKEPW